MNSSQEIHQLIDAYLFDELNVAEKMAFEKRLEEDANFQGLFQTQKAFIEDLNHYQNIEKIKKQFGNSDLENQNNPNLISNSRPLFVKYIAYSTAIAASVAILFAWGFLSYFNSNKPKEKLASQKLVNRIAHNQKNIWNLVKEKLSDKEVQISNGTGFVIAKNGYLITCNHVVQDAKFIYVSNDENRFKAEIFKQDIEQDLAILQITDTNFQNFNNLPYAIDNQPTKLGNEVYTLGFPKKDIVFGEGSISSLSGNQSDTTQYQISVPVNPGNSGGPLIDVWGNFLGIINARNSQKDGTAFAIKSNHLMQILEDFPVDSIHPKPILPNKNYLRWLNKSQQIERIQPFVFRVDVY